MQLLSVREIIAANTPGMQVMVRGWLRTARHGKSCSFLEVYDGSSFSTLQCVADPQLENYENEIKKLNTGCSVTIAGELASSPGKGQAIELQAKKVITVGAADPDYPLQKKQHSYEFLRTIQHLRLRTNTFGAILRVRNTVAMLIHEFFQERGFVWLHTPVITASDSEGAGQMFRVTTLNAEKPPLTPAGKVDFSQDFFAAEAHLTVSGQLEGEAGALAVGKIYTFGPTFGRKTPIPAGISRNSGWLSRKLLLWISLAT